MDIEKVRQLSDPELENALKEAKQDLWGARFALSTRQLKDYSTIPQRNRRIAAPGRLLPDHSVRPARSSDRSPSAAFHLMRR